MSRQKYFAIVCVLQSFIAVICLEDLDLVYFPLAPSSSPPPSFPSPPLPSPPPLLPRRYLRRPVGMSGVGLYDPTEVMNRAQLTLFFREGFVKVGFYVLLFLVYLYK